MLEIGVQSRNVVEDSCPEKGFRMLKDAGFSCTDFSLNSYLTNKDLYEGKVNAFFSQSIQELEQFFSAHKEGAKKGGNPDQSDAHAISGIYPEWQERNQ